MGEFFTVDQVAKILDMHPRTVRRYVREGQLRATKVGGEWRIRREDADMFMGMNAKELFDHGIEDVQSYIDGFAGQARGKFQVMTVLDCYVEDKSEAYEISKVVMRHMNEDQDIDQAKSQYFYDTATKKGRYILWGSPSFIGRILSSVGDFSAQSR